jgi:hypothetical protein
MAIEATRPRRAPSVPKERTNNFRFLGNNSAVGPDNYKEDCPEREVVDATVYRTCFMRTEPMVEDEKHADRPLRRWTTSSDRIEMRTACPNMLAGATR